MHSAWIRLPRTTTARCFSHWPTDAGISNLRDVTGEAFGTGPSVANHQTGAALTEAAAALGVTCVVVTAGAHRQDGRADDVRLALPTEIKGCRIIGDAARLLNRWTIVVAQARITRQQADAAPSADATTDIKGAIAVAVAGLEVTSTTWIDRVARVGATAGGVVAADSTICGRRGSARRAAHAIRRAAQGQAVLASVWAAWACGITRHQALAGDAARRHADQAADTVKSGIAGLALELIALGVTGRSDRVVVLIDKGLAGLTVATAIGLVDGAAAVTNVCVTTVGGRRALPAVDTDVLGALALLTGIRCSEADAGPITEPVTELGAAARSRTRRIAFGVAVGDGIFGGPAVANADQAPGTITGLGGSALLTQSLAARRPADAAAIGQLAAAVICGTGIDRSTGLTVRVTVGDGRGVGPAVDDTGRPIGASAAAGITHSWSALAHTDVLAIERITIVTRLTAWRAQVAAVLKAAVVNAQRRAIAVVGRLAGCANTTRGPGIKIADTVDVVLLGHQPLATSGAHDRSTSVIAAIAGVTNQARMPKTQRVAHLMCDRRLEAVVRPATLNHTVDQNVGIKEVATGAAATVRRDRDAQSSARARAGHGDPLVFA